jgi:DsbC/DsbD-like thiol-disulfide interchange protein
VAAMVLLKLGRPDEAGGVLRAFAGQLVQHVQAMSSLAQALMEYLNLHAPLHVPAGASPAAKQPPSPHDLADEVVELQAAWAGPRELHVRLEISNGWHVNANPAAGGLTSTQVEVVGDTAAAVAFYEYPKPENHVLGDRRIPVYTGAVSLKIHFKGDMTGIGKLRIAVTYQPCDEKSCLPGIRKEFELNTP